MSSSDVLSLLEKLRQEQQFVSFYKQQLRNGVQELNKNCDHVFQSLWVTHTLTFALGRVLSHHIPPYEWSLALEQGVTFTDAANILSQDTDAYSQFLMSLLTETRLLADVLTLAHTDGLDSQHLLSDLMTVVFGHCLFQNDHALYLQLLQELLRQHVNGCSSPEELFSGSESLFNRALCEYCSNLTSLRAFLSHLLVDTTLEVLSYDDYLEFDVSKAGRRFHSNSDKTASLVETSTFLFSEDLDVSCGQLATLAMKLVKKLESLLSQLPPGLRWLFGCLKRFCKQRWPISQQLERRVLADALYGGIISSALINPDTHSIIDPGVVVGTVARYNLTQVTAILQRSAWGLEKDSVSKVVKKMDMSVYWSVLERLDEGLTEKLPELPLHLPGLKRSSFLASQTQLHNLVGLAASLLANREGRGVFHTQISELISKVSHKLVDEANMCPYSVSSLTPTHTATATKKSRNKKRGSMAKIAHTAVEPLPRSRSLGTYSSIDTRGTSPPTESLGFVLPKKVLILPFPIEGGGSSWDFHLLAEDEFMSPTSPTTKIPEPDSPSTPTTPLELNPAPHISSTPTTTTTLVAELEEGIAIEGGRLRSNTLPPPKSPGHIRALNESGSSWSPAKGGWLLGLKEEESPYDRLEAKDAYLPSSDSSIPTSPASPLHSSHSSRTTLSLHTTPTPPLRLNPPISELEEVTKENSSSPEDPTTTKKSKKRKKFWPFRKHKSGDKRKDRSRSEAKVTIDAAPPKSRAFSDGTELDEPAGIRSRRSYTLLTGHITAKYAAGKARERVAEARTRIGIVPRAVVEKKDSKSPAKMSPVSFKRSLYYDQLKFKLRSALQNITSMQSFDSDTDTREQLIMLTQKSLQHSRWQQDSMELSLLTELLRMLQLLPNTLVNVAVEGLWKDYQKRSSYTDYLVSKHQRFQDAQRQVATLQAAVDRLKTINSEMFVSHAVSEFLDIRDSELQELLREMATGLPADDKVSLMDARQNVLAETISKDSTWLCWNDMDAVVDQLDDRLFARAYEHLFHPNGDSDTMRDQIFSEHLTRLSETISVTHKSLQIPVVYHSSCPWESAQTYLKVMSSYKSPRGKVWCVVNCCKVLIGLLQLAKCGDPPGADDMFPVIVYVLLKANPPGLLSTVQYVKNFCESSLSGESAYWWAQVSTAVEFTKTLE